MYKCDFNKDIVGNFLVSSPLQTKSDDCFNQAVILIASHSNSGTLGILLNRSLQSIDCSFICKALDLEVTDFMKDLPVFFGGPVESNRGVILHSSDYKKDAIIDLGNGVSISSNVNIIQDIAKGKGPENKIIALGYAGWHPGQLEKEMKQDFWINVPFSKDIAFDIDIRDKWQASMDSINLKYNFFTGNGNA